MRSLTLLSKTKIRRRPQTVLSEIADRCGRHGGEPDLRRDGRGGAVFGLFNGGRRGGGRVSRRPYLVRIPRLLNQAPRGCRKYSQSWYGRVASRGRRSGRGTAPASVTSHRGTAARGMPPAPRPVHREDAMPSTAPMPLSRAWAQNDTVPPDASSTWAKHRKPAAARPRAAGAHGQPGGIVESKGSRSTPYSPRSRIRRQGIMRCHLRSNSRSGSIGGAARRRPGRTQHHDRALRTPDSGEPQRGGYRSERGEPAVPLIRSGHSWPPRGAAMIRAGSSRLGREYSSPDPRKRSADRLIQKGGQQSGISPPVRS